MEHIRRLVAFRVVRFAAVGVANTLLNFLILNIAYYGFHQNKLGSSLIATSFAVVFSFVLNRNFVFLDKGRSSRQLVLFIIVTVSGVMLVQNSVYSLGTAVLYHREYLISNLIRLMSGFRIRDDFINVNVSNALASLCVMVWNYNGYRVLVFKGHRQGDYVVETD